MSSFTRASSDFIDTGEKRGAGYAFKLFGRGFWWQEGTPIMAVPEGFMYEIGYLGSGLIVHVPTGFKTDGASWPRLLKRLLPRGLYNKLRAMMAKSAAVHDRWRELTQAPKHTGDLIFLDAMYAEGTPSWLREPSFLLVRLNKSRTVWNKELNNEAL